MLKTEQFALLLAPCEKQALEKLAEHDGGLSKAAMVRRLIRHAARDRGLWPEVSA